MEKRRLVMATEKGRPQGACKTEDERGPRVRGGGEEQSLTGLLLDIWHPAEPCNARLLSMMPKSCFAWYPPAMCTLLLHCGSQCTAMHIGLCRAALLSASCHKEGLQDNGECTMLTGIKSTCFTVQGDSLLLVLVAPWTVVRNHARWKQHCVQQHLAVSIDLIRTLRTNCSGRADTRLT